MLTKKNDHNDFVKVVDFGIAKIISETTMGSTQLTKTGDVFGHFATKVCFLHDVIALTILKRQGCAKFAKMGTCQFCDSFQIFLKLTGCV